MPLSASVRYGHLHARWGLGGSISSDYSAPMSVVILACEILPDMVLTSFLQAGVPIDHHIQHWRRPGCTGVHNDQKSLPSAVTSAIRRNVVSERREQWLSCVCFE